MVETKGRATYRLASASPQCATFQSQYWHVAIKILDGIVRDVGVPEANDDQQGTILGGLDADLIDFPTRTHWTAPSAISMK